MLPQLSDVLGPAVEIDDVEGVTVLGVNPPWLPRSSRGLKRAMDLVVSVSLLVLLAPLGVLIAIAIKLDSPGPVFFAQERVGRGGRRFRLFKFRTMVNDAEEQRAALVQQSGDPLWLKLSHDPRITRVGRRLRRLSLDELPQLYNVLRSEMSLVGPRPLILSEDELVQGWARGRLDLTPGLTGYWQVLGRTRIPFEEMVKLDYLYVMNWSLWGGPSPDHSDPADRRGRPRRELRQRREFAHGGGDPLNLRVGHVRVDRQRTDPLRERFADRERAFVEACRRVGRSAVNRGRIVDRRADTAPLEMVAQAIAVG